MKAIKSLLAVSVLAAAGAANAATFNFNYTEVGVLDFEGPFDVFPNGSMSGSGTAVLDDVLGTLTLTGTQVAISTIGGTQNMTNTIVLNGSVAGGVFTATSGTNTPLTCSGSCTYVTPVLGQPVPYTSVSGSFAIAAGGAITTTLHMVGQSLGTNTLTFTPEAPAVPVPAAAWLFGSGLLGLAGTARRRRRAE